MGLRYDTLGEMITLNEQENTSSFYVWRYRKGYA